jgi:hypothetical protein
VKKLDEFETEEKVYFNRENMAIGFGEYDKDWWQNTWQTLLYFNAKPEIVHIAIPYLESTKWLYELWIAGTTIIDDLEEENEQH